MPRWLKIAVWCWLLFASIFTIIVQFSHLEHGIATRGTVVLAAIFTAGFAGWQLRKLWLGLSAL